MPSNALKRYLEKAAARYHDQLVASAPPAGVIAYFRDHGIAKTGILRDYKLGYVAQPLPGDEQFMGSISIPYLTPNGVAALKFRGIESNGAKYNQMRGQKTRLFNPAAYFSAGDTIGITEGEVDAIVGTERLGLPSVGVPGSSNWLDIWTPLFRDFSRVLVFADGDDAGRAFAARAAERIGWRSRVVQCPDGEDVASMVAAGRGDELLKLCSTSKDEDDL